MKVYVATKFENGPRARQVMDALEAQGFEITYDWTPELGETREQAVADVDGVRTADVLVVLMEENYDYQGTLIEIGIALGAERPVLIVGDAYDHAVFFKHPLVRRVTAAELNIPPHQP
jgi:nucleoside 2-deoxyribosyltransferase